MGTGRKKKEKREKGGEGKVLSSPFLISVQVRKTRRLSKDFSGWPPKKR